MFEISSLRRSPRQGGAIRVSDYRICDPKWRPIARVREALIKAIQAVTGGG